MRHVEDPRASQFVARGDVAPVDVVGDGDLRREGLAPNLVALLRTWHRERDDRLQPTHEGIVDIGALVGRKNDEAVIGLDPLQQIGDFLVSIFVVGIADVGAFAEERVCLVEEQDPALFSALSTRCSFRPF